MSTFRALGTLLPYHLLSYSIVFGMTVYQSFVMVKIAHKALPAAEFMKLQKRVFPMYFLLQGVFSLATLATFPPRSVLSLLQGRTGIRWADVTSLTLMVAMAGLNAAVYTPRTIAAMELRSKQAIRDHQLYGDHPTPSAALNAVSRDFSRNHAMSVHVNAVAVVSMLWYGLSLAGRLKLAL